MAKEAYQLREIVYAVNEGAGNILFRVNILQKFLLVNGNIKSGISTVHTNSGNLLAG